MEKAAIAQVPQTAHLCALAVVVGEAAATQVPGKGVQIFQHWKADLLAGKASEVGIAFFTELKASLQKMGLLRDIARYVVRICIPKLDGHAGSRKIILDVLSKAGWGAAKIAETVFEPEANAIGFFTRGRNATWYPPSVSQLYPNYAMMLDPDGLFHRIRKTALSGEDPNYGVLVMDIGGFTTDFGYN